MEKNALVSFPMQPVSASDALGLAFAHTRTVLGSAPFRVGRFLKLALLAALTQATFLSISITYPLQGAEAGSLSRVRHMQDQLLASDGIGAFAGALGLGLLLAVLVLVLVVTLAYLYLFCRARATLYEMVLTRSGRIRDAWRRQARPARRYFGLLLLAMLLFWTILAAVLGPVLVRFVKVGMAHPGAGGAAPGVGSLLLTMVGLVWLLLPIYIAVDALLQDFILPGLVLESEAPVSMAFARLGRLLRQSPGQLLLYLLLRTVVALAIALALGLVVLVVLGLLALIAFGVGRALYHLLWAGSLGAHALFFAVVAAMVLVLVILYWLSVVAIYGVSGTFKTSYAACFFAGYYPQLSMRLQAFGEGSPAMTTLPLQADLPPQLW